MRGKSFEYTIPACGTTTGKPILARAWKTCCPGLIVQQQVEGDQFYMVHENSGFITARVDSVRDGQMWAGAVAGLPINWKVKKGFEIHWQVSKLNDSATEIFSAMISGSPTPNPKKWRKHASKTKKQFQNYVKKMRREA